VIFVSSVSSVVRVFPTLAVTGRFTYAATSQWGGFCLGDDGGAMDTPGQTDEEHRERWASRAARWRETTTTRTPSWQAATDLMIAALDIRPGMTILDVASGPGEPAISLAAAVAPGGRVTATDLVPEMLAMAEENARVRGVANITFRQADVAALPFSDGEFDAVTCRFGVMIFPDVQRGLSEMRRVLAPSGRAVCLLWGPPEQNAQMRPLAVVRRFVSLPEPAPGEPHRFRFAAPGELAAQLRAAGFRQVEEATYHLPVQWAGAPEERWEAMLRNNRRMAAAVAALAPERHAALTCEVLDAIRAEACRTDGGTAAVALATGLR
jgi:ubiquinone/menaquinone biosynthesis C-methylase UbiE